MAFLVKVLFRWNESLENADINVLRKFLTIFFDFFLDIEKFDQVLSTCQISDQLNLQTEITEGGGGGNLPSPDHTNLQKARMFRVKESFDIFSLIPWKHLKISTKKTK